jgi:organic hydroperoxide reductase OsmC/OhrA
VSLKEATLIESHDYFIELGSSGLKTGILGAPSDGLPSVDVASPPEFGGPAGVWSPEHLFVASLASCLMTTFRAIADASGLDVLGYADNASGHLQRGEDRLYSFDTVTLRPHVLVADEDKVAKALRLLEKAEKVCLVSRSVSSQILLEPVVEVASPATA